MITQKNINSEKDKTISIHFEITKKNNNKQCQGCEVNKTLQAQLVRGYVFSSIS